jgi:cyclopropane fatty-acyl-phospholipid synthase-like methyltransferase
VSEQNWTLDEVAELYNGASQMADKYFYGYERLGYWYDDTDEASFEEGAERLTSKVVDTLGLRRGESVLEAGCGLGTAAVHVAGEHGVRITGITISPVEAESAQARASETAVADQVRFEVADYHALPYPENHFDAVLAIESLLHSFSLDKALLEFHRVLRPGGRVAIAEMAKTSPDSQAAAPFPQAREPMVVDRWLAEFEAAGFVVEERIESRRAYANTGKRHIEHHDRVSDQLAQEYGEEMTVAIRQGMEESFRLGPEHLTYMILCARKR